MKTRLSAQISRKRLALTGVAAASAFLATNPSPAGAQGFYNYVVNTPMNMPIVSVSGTNSGATSETQTGTSAMGAINIPGLNTVHSVTAISIQEDFSRLYFTQTLAGGLSDTLGATLHLSGSINLFYTIAAAATSTLVATLAPTQIGVGNSQQTDGVYFQTYFQPFNTVNLTMSSFSQYVHEGIQGNFGSLSTGYDIVDNSTCTSYTSAPNCQNWSEKNYQMFVSITYYLQGAPAPSSAAVFLPGLSAGLLLLRRRRRACLGAAGCIGPPSRE